jgi:protein-tyrosine phosphatase
MTESSKSYQSLYDKRIFIGGAQDVIALVEDEAVEIIVDLRAEMPEGNTELPEHVTRIHVPLIDRTAGQEELLKQAVDHVVSGFASGKKVAIHCAAGRSRAGSVAVGTLLALGLSDSVDEAEAKVKEIRPEVEVHSELRKSLAALYEI